MQINITSESRAILKEIYQTLEKIRTDDLPEHTADFKRLSKQYWELNDRSPIGDLHRVQEGK